MYKGRNISVVIPAYNEESMIGDVLGAMPDWVDQLIVVDDGSADDTAGIARARGAHVFSHSENRGVGAAFSTGRRAALDFDTDIMVNIDADGQFDPRDIEKLLDPISEGRADFVTASRFKDPALYPDMSRIKFLGNRLMSFVVSRVTGRKFYDVSCGFRAYTREALLRLNLFGDFTYTQETFLNFAFKNISILEIPLAVKGKREQGKSRVASNLFRYGFQTWKITVRTLRDYRPFKMFAALSLVMMILGLAFLVFLAIHYAETGTFTPHKWAGFTGGFFVLMSSLSFVLGFILDMFVRMRMNQEEVLYHLLKADHDKK